ncbi:BfmA/BtgA family mobilization protein [Sphingobacterium mizutaii]|uniref:BfmA/BtgA family mobilization protein n=1 Tax=Sphingobacterium mizutaii TaxID=1010 RepID=UPI002897E782|nr:BfmA/BtgA family mobilization protein [Sphingobacterium mizutaii]
MDGKVDKNMSLKFSLQVDTKFDNLARKLGRTKRTLVIHMIDYFNSTKKDPIDRNSHVNWLNSTEITRWVLKVEEARIICTDD